MPVIREHYPVCTRCVHLRSGGTCAAFPEGIPRKVWRGKSAHLTPIRGQVGDIVLMVATEQDAEDLQAIGLVEDSAEVQVSEAP